MRIAIIGAGISGNLVARLLADDHDIELFEAEPRVGGHARTLDVRAFGREYRVDTGFMVYNERTYPHFCRLLRLLGVEGVDTDMSLSVRCERTGLEYQGSTLGGLFAQRRNLLRPAFLRMLWDVLRFHRRAPGLLESNLEGVRVADLLAGQNAGQWFWEKYLLPMAGAIWSCSPDDVLNFPAHFLLGFLRNHGLLQVRDRPQWKTVGGSARRYVDRLVSPFRDRIRLACPISAVLRQGGSVLVRPKDAPTETFDRVIFAVDGRQTLAMLGDADPLEREVLGCFRSQRNEAILHTDTSLLPRRRQAWASWNCLLPQEPGAPAGVTYDLSRLQGLDTPSPILLTLNATARIDPATVLDSCVFKHPAYTNASVAAQRRWGEINGRRGTYFCGAYWGFGFHEDGVRSALAVAQCFDKSLDTWKAASTKASSAMSATSR